MNNCYMFFKKLSYPIKIEILTSLIKKDKSVQELSRDLKIEQSKLSHALQSLKACSIVQATRQGKKMIYSLNKETVLPIFKMISKHEKSFCNCGCCAKQGVCKK
jgi:DNA-binding transcriptional ArsR family regulator